MIHKIQDGTSICFVISSRQVWLPGSYESERAAKYAFRFKDEELSQLEENAIKNNNGTISFVDLQAYRALRKPKE